MSKKQVVEAFQKQASQVDRMSEDELFSNLDSVKDRICNKVKMIQQQEEERKVKDSAYKDTIKQMKEELTEDINFKGLLEHKLKVDKFKEETRTEDLPV